jgi:hypothetical protein
MSNNPSKSLSDRDGAVRELTDGDVRQFRQLSQALTLLTWMVGIHSAFVMAIFTKLFLL